MEELTQKQIDYLSVKYPWCKSAKNLSRLAKIEIAKKKNGL